MLSSSSSSNMNNFYEMNVTKRNGNIETVSFDKILNRIKTIGHEVGINLNYTNLTMKVIDQLYDKISTTKIDELSAEQCASMASIHPDYNVLAGRIIISNFHKNTNESFSYTMRQLYEITDVHGNNTPLLSNELYDIVNKYSEELDKMCDYSRDYLIDYFGFKTLERAYLLKKNKKPIERPQHLWLRVSIGIHGDNLEKVRETYNNMSQKYFTHATPTLFNSGTPRPQMSSCFLLQMENDSIDGIYNTLKDCANISKWAGGIGLHIHNVRASGSYIRGTGGTSNGIVPMLKVFNNTAKYVDQCVANDTKILTESGEWISIENAKSGMKIANMKIIDPDGFSNENFFRTNETKDPVGILINEMNAVSLSDSIGRDFHFDKIKNVFSHKYAGLILKINFVDTMRNSLRLTGDHPVLCKSEESVSIFQWKEAKLLEEGNVIMIDPGQLIQIANIEETYYDGTVYDLEMETYANYFTESGLVHNGGGKRNGSFAIYLEPWHADIEMFLQMRKNHGDEELKARDLFYALWIPDLFMERIKSGGNWTLMCPDECPGLSDVYGEEFNSLYEKYETEGRGKKTIAARDLWFQILDSQMETGTPYLCYKDAANKKSNQKNVGIIKSSNLCVAGETMILTDKGQYPISQIYGQTVNVWNGEEFSQVKIEKTNDNAELIDVYTSDGCKLSCTKYHKFYVVSEDDGLITEKQAIELCLGDELLQCDHFEVIDNKGNDLTDAYKLGVETDGYYQPYVPINCSLKTKIEWFSGYCEKRLLYNTEADGFITNYSFYIELPQRLEFLRKIKLMLQTCGINIVVDKSENLSNWDRLILTGKNIKKLLNIGFKINNAEAQSILEKYANHLSNDCTPSSKNHYYGEVETKILINRLEDNGRRGPTYCFSEPKRHMGVFGGLLTGQCTEIMEVSTPGESAVCNLASIGLPTFVNPVTREFDYNKLHEISKIVTYNLNRIIDVNFYPTDKTRNSNMRHRPIGIGVQGLADVYMLMGISFISDEAKKMNKYIFETIYHGALTESCNLSKTLGPYETFAGSPASNGILQFDMWGVTPESGKWDWNSLKEEIKQHGLRNSLLLAPMPTASTSQILGYNECIEPITSNIYSRRTLAGEFIMANKYLMKDLLELNLWNEKIKNNIIANNGSVQQIDIIPQEIRDRYKTVWEIPMRHLIDMAVDRGAYVCQSQSLNLWLEDPNYGTLTSMHFYGWSKGLKTGIYYLRRRGKHQAQQFTIEVEKKQDNNHIEEDEICEMCSA